MIRSTCKTAAPAKRAEFNHRAMDQDRTALVQCEGYRGLAWRTSHGQWRTIVGDLPLPPQVEIIQPV